MNVQNPPRVIHLHAHADACSRLERCMDAFTASLTTGDIPTARRWLAVSRRIADLFGLTASLANTLDGWRWRAVPIRR